jgi:hypothetical protein
MQCNAMQCNAMQRNAECKEECNAMQSAMQCKAECNAMQCKAECNAMHSGVQCMSARKERRYVKQNTMHCKRITTLSKLQSKAGCLKDTQRNAVVK